ncbi:MAG TPA: peptidoglycan editing factor PgeF [Ignavibacteriaceae bacterium]|nr:peptidoglycan editing factor PgeF [Ignavibacteriaceae bacterium]
MVIIKSLLLSNYPEIIFGFSTKIAADRKPPFYFNLSFSVGDDINIVKENRRLFFQSLGLAENQIITQKQIHSDIIRLAEKRNSNSESDALITDKNNFGLAVSAADCAPIFLYDKKNRIISAVHSGWRGTQKKILLKTLNRLSADFGSKGENLIAFIGPSIKQKNYQVGEDVAELFDSKYLLKENDKYFLDIPLVNFDMLAGFGIKKENIEISSLCTFENSFLLHSYRRDGIHSGRSLGIIALKSADE